MIKNIEVKEKNLIDKLNDNVARWDNHGPVQFEEENKIDPETYNVGENFPDNRDKYYDNDVNVKKDTITLHPRNPDGTFADVLDVDYDAKEVEESRVSCCNKKPLAEVKKVIDGLKGTRLRTYSEALDNLRKSEQRRIDDIIKRVSENRNYEEVNHPDHYNQYDVEVIDMMERVFGKEETAIFCKLNAFKYRQRMGNKPGQDVLKDLAKEKWYLDKKKELEQK